MRHIFFIASLFFVNAAYAQEFDEFHACIGTELEGRARYHGFLMCGESESCNTEKIIGDPSFLYSFIRLSCGQDQMERCIVSSDIEGCLGNFTQTLLDLREGIAVDIDADRVSAAAMGLGNLTKNNLFQEHELLNDSFNDDFYDPTFCSSLYSAVEKALAIPDNLHCQAITAIFFWSSAEDFRDKIISSEMTAQ
ncbi:hypothetical protein [Parasulfitobacter algicola]|nr:hypothetical protein [Sulfitobacter algicola]